jgi:hypothetical protein
MKRLYILLVLMGMEIVQAMESGGNLENFKLSLEKAVQDHDFTQVSELVAQKPLFSQLSASQLESLKKKSENQWFLLHEGAKLDQVRIDSKKSQGRTVKLLVGFLGFSAFTVGSFTLGGTYRETDSEIKASYGLVSAVGLSMGWLMWVGKQTMSAYYLKKIRGMNDDLKPLIEKRNNAEKIKHFFDIYSVQQEQATSVVVPINKTIN